MGNTDKTILMEKLEGKLAEALGVLHEIYPSYNNHDVHNIETPHRVAKMWIEMFRGLDEPDFNFKKFPNEEATYNTIPNENWVILKNIDFSSMCFPNKTRIRTTNGVKFIKDIKIGDSILTFTDSGNLIEKKVTEVFKRKSEELISFKTKKGKKFECTPEHPIFIKGKGWVEAKNISMGDSVYTLRNAKGFVRTQTLVDINYGKDLGYFLGALLADGSVSSRNQVRLEVTEKWFAEKFANCIKSSFGLEATIETIPYVSGFKGKDPSKKLYRVRVVSGYLVNIIDELCGGRKKTKTFTIPKVIFNDYETFCGFFEGYIDGDGTEYTKGKNRYNRIISSNTKFISEVSEMFGTYVGNVGETCQVVTVPLFLNKRNKRKLYEEKFIEKFNNCYKNTEAVVIDKFREEDEIIAIAFRNKKGNKPFTVYNFEVEDEHTYIANDVWVHNCQHHLLPFSGIVSIAYVPRDEICGISKLARVVEYFSLRPQVQERMSSEIYTYLYDELKPKRLVVITEAKHDCVACRGIKSRNSSLITTLSLYPEDVRDVRELIK